MAHYNVVLLTYLLRIMGQDQEKVCVSCVLRSLKTRACLKNREPAMFLACVVWDGKTYFLILLHVLGRL